MSWGGKEASRGGEGRGVCGKSVRREATEVTKVPIDGNRTMSSRICWVGLGAGRDEARWGVVAWSEVRLAGVEWLWLWWRSIAWPGVGWGAVGWGMN